MKPWLAAAVFFLITGTAWAAGDPPLIAAISAGDDAAATALIKEKTGIDAAQSNGTTPLMWAVYQDDAALVKALLKAGADAKVTNDFGASAMSVAAENADPQVIAALLKAGADADSPNKEGETALMVVARTGNVDAAKILIKAGANVNAREKWGGQSALMWAAAQKQPQMIHLLLEAGAAVNAKGIDRDWQRRVTSEPRPKDLDRGGFAALHYAAREGCIACARELVKGGADIDITDPDRTTPLVVALLNLRFDLAAYLVDAGADVDKWDLYGRSPLYVAVDMDTLPKGGRPDLPSADRNSGLDLAKLLLAKGANVNVQLKLRPPYRNVIFDRGGDDVLSTGATPLLLAAKVSDDKAISLLLEHGALIDLPNAQGVTPLMVTAGLDHGANPTRGRYKTEDDGIASLKILLAHGAQINARSSDGRSALFGAALKGWVKLSEFLIRNGAEIDAANADGKTAIDIAKGNYSAGRRGKNIDPNPQLAAMLQKYAGQAEHKL